MAEDLEEDFDEGEGSEDFDAPPAQSGDNGRKKLILFVVLPLLLVIGAGAGAYFGGAADPLLNLFGNETVEPEEQVAAGPAVFYDLPEMLVNLNTVGRKQSFLKIRVSLELADQRDVQRIEQVMPRIIDNFQVYLRELRIEDLQGASGIYRLREELLTRVAAAAKPARINDVLFKDILVQ